MASAKRWCGHYYLLPGADNLLIERMSCIVFQALQSLILAYCKTLCSSIADIRKAERHALTVMFLHDKLIVLSFDGVDSIISTCSIVRLTMTLYIVLSNWEEWDSKLIFIMIFRR